MGRTQSDMLNHFSYKPINCILCNRRTILPVPPYVLYFTFNKQYSIVASNINKRLGELYYVSIKIRLGQSLGNRKIQSIVKHARKFPFAKRKLQQKPNSQSLTGWIQLTLAQSFRTGPPGLISWWAGTTTLCQSRLQPPVKD